MKKKIILASKKIESKLLVMSVIFTKKVTLSSVYFDLYNCGRIKTVRVSDHEGHKLPKSTIQVRTDRCTCRDKRVYSDSSIKAVADLIFKEKLKAGDL